MMRISSTLSLLALLAVVGASCGPKIPTSPIMDKDGNLRPGLAYADLTLKNKDANNAVQFRWKSWKPGSTTADAEVLVQANSILIAPGETKALDPQAIIVAQGGRLELSYLPGGALVNLESIPVPQAHLSRQIDLEVVAGYDEKVAEGKLTNLATNPATQLLKQAKGRSLDAVEVDMGSFLVCEGPDNNIVDRIHLQDVDLVEPNPMPSLTGAVVATSTVMANLSVKVPIYANVESSMSGSDFYNIMWDIRYFNLDTTFSPSAALAATVKEKDKGTLQQILLALKLHPSAKIMFISGGTAIKTASFSSAKGTKFEVKADFSVLSMVTGGAAYGFLQKDEKVSAFSDLVTDTVLRPVAENQAELIGWIQDQLKAPNVERKPPEETRDRSREVHLEPTRLGDTER